MIFTRYFILFSLQLKGSRSCPSSVEVLAMPLRGGIRDATKKDSLSSLWLRYSLLPFCIHGYCLRNVRLRGRPRRSLCRLFYRIGTVYAMFLPVCTFWFSVHGHEHDWQKVTKKKAFCQTPPPPRGLVAHCRQRLVNAVHRHQQARLLRRRLAVDPAANWRSKNQNWRSGYASTGTNGGESVSVSGSGAVCRLSRSRQGVRTL
jgi:hypothetical protein